VNNMYKKWVNTLAKCALFEGIDTEEMLTILGCMGVKILDYKKMIT
jgi:hypothetical protein